MTHPSTTLNLVADIGGTNTRVALAKGAEVLSNTVSRYANKNHGSLDEVLHHFVQEQGGVDTAAACVALAGPVRNGTATMTNLDWTIDNATLAAATGAETTSILNDLQAQGHALGHLSEDNIKTVVQSTNGSDGAAQLIVGLGTGFNIAPVFHLPNGVFVAASESGHISLPAATSSDLELVAFLEKKHGFATIEDALSGGGLENLYRFEAYKAGSSAERSAAQIMTACANKDDPIAIQSVKRFVQILGKACGDLALVQLPFGGVYLVGGVARAIAPYLDEFGFASAFTSKGRFEDFMKSFGVYVIDDDYAALRGSAAHLMTL